MLSNRNGPVAAFSKRCGVSAGDNHDVIGDDSQCVAGNREQRLAVLEREDFGVGMLVKDWPMSGRPRGDED
jgi:hypothetical protein